MVMMSIIFVALAFSRGDREKEKGGRENGCVKVNMGHKVEVEKKKKKKSVVVVIIFSSDSANVDLFFHYLIFGKFSFIVSFLYITIPIYSARIYKST